MKNAQSQLIPVMRLLFRAALYLLTLYLFFLLARGGYNLIVSFSVPFGLSAVASFILNTLLIALFLCFAILLIFHFFRTTDSN